MQGIHSSIRVGRGPRRRRSLTTQATHTADGPNHPTDTDTAADALGRAIIMSEREPAEQEQQQEQGRMTPPEPVLYASRDSSGSGIVLVGACAALCVCT